LVTKEWTALDQGHVEQKYFAPGIGLVHVDEQHGKIVRVELVDMFNTPKEASKQSRSDSHPAITRSPTRCP
jgi:hypothetical protein